MIKFFAFKKKKKKKRGNGGIPLLVIAYCDNSGISGMVTLKSPSGVFAVLVFPIRKQITVSNLFSAAYLVYW